MNLISTDSTLYRKIRPLGEGSFGEVFLVKHARTGQLLVSKEMRLQGLDEATTIQLYTEAKVLQTLKHPNIVQMHESYRTKSNKLVLVLEYASNGDLANYIERCEGKHIEEAQIRVWALQLCLALKHSHDYKVVHRDIKTSNVFLDADNNVKLGDFGLARNLVGSRQASQGIAGTPLYLSPEAITNGICSFKGDVWSLGVIIHELCSLRNPFMTTNYANLMFKVCTEAIPAIPELYSAELQTFVSALLERDDAKRPTIRQLFETDLLQATLMQNKAEFRKLINSTTESNVDISSSSVKTDFARMKVYRFSEFKDPGVLLQNIQQMISREDRVSKFNRKRSGDIFEESIEEESNSLDKSQTSGRKHRLFVPLEEKGKTDRSCRSLGKERTISHFKALDDSEQQPKGLFPLSNIPEQDLTIENVNSDNQIVSFYNSVMKLAMGRETKQSMDNRITADTKKPNLSAAKGNYLLDSFLDGNSQSSSGLVTPKHRQHAKSSDRGSADVDLDDITIRPSEDISFNYSFSPQKKSIRASQFLCTLDSNPFNLNIHELGPVMQKESISEARESSQKPKKSFFTHYKEPDATPVRSKFKISAADKTSKTIEVRAVKQKSVAPSPNNNGSNVHLVTPVKSTKKRFMIKSSIREIPQFENETKLRLKQTFTANGKYNVMKLNLNSVAELPSHTPKKGVGVGTKPARIAVSKKCITITSLNNLSKMHSINAAQKAVNSRTSNASKLSLGSDGKKVSAVLKNLTSNVNEYGLSGLGDANRRSNCSKSSSLTEHDEAKPNTRLEEPNIGKGRAYFMQRYGDAFDDAYMTAKRFIVHSGTKNMNALIDSEDLVYDMLENFADGDMTRMGDKRLVVELVRFAIFELQTQLL